MKFGVRGLVGRLACVAALLAPVAAAAAPAVHGPYILVDLGNGDVLAERQSFDAWYPASITKLMDVYVTLDAVERGELRLDSGVRMSEASTREAPSRMGFPPGTVLTIDTALKIIMVKSANDVAMALAERVGGSLQAFVDRMNDTAARLGMVNTHFANANGLPNPNQWTSARDYALLARALRRDHPSANALYEITALSLDGKIIRNHNNLLERFPGADGMKTGFICAGGFNVVATAERDGRRLLAVVLGGDTARQRDEFAAWLLESGFEGRLPPRPVTTLDRLSPATDFARVPTDIRDSACPKKRPEPTLTDGDEEGGDEAPATYLQPRSRLLAPVPIALGGASDMPDPPKLAPAPAKPVKAVVARPAKPSKPAKATTSKPAKAAPAKPAKAMPPNPAAPVKAATAAKAATSSGKTAKIAPPPRPLLKPVQD